MLPDRCCNPCILFDPLLATIHTLIFGVKRKQRGAPEVISCYELLPLQSSEGVEPDDEVVGGLALGSKATTFTFVVPASVPTGRRSAVAGLSSLDTDALTLGEQLCYGQLPTGHHVSTVDGITFGEDADVIPRAINRRGALAQIHDQHHAAACFEPRQSLLDDVRVGVAGRDHPHCQVGRTVPVTLYAPRFLYTFAADESRVGSVHGVGGSEASLKLVSAA